MDIVGTNVGETLLGTANNDYIQGLAGNDILRGNGGEDSLDGGDGDDELHGGDWNEGGEGNDLIDATVGSPDGWEHAVYANETGGVGILANLSSATAGGVASGSVRDTYGNIDTLVSIEGIIGSRYADTIYTSDADEYWYSAAGLAGNDTIIGGLGPTQLRYEQETQFGGTHGVVVNLTATTIDGIAGGHVRDSFGDLDTVSGVEIIYATKYADALYGGSGGEVFAGFTGRDLINGGGGHDTAMYGSDAEIYGWGASDTIGNKGVLVNLGSSAITISGVRLAGGTARDGWGDIDKLVSIEEIWGTRFSDTMYASASGSSLWGDAGNDRLNGDVRADNLWGGNGNDVLAGGLGRDVLIGDAGADRLSGGRGADKLTGGIGADIFSYASLADSTLSASGRDTIYDFSRGEHDRLHLSGIDANTRITGNQAFHFVGTHAFSSHAGELRIARTGGDVYVYGDVNGDRRADFAIHLDHLSTLGVNDFYL